MAASFDFKKNRKERNLVSSTFLDICTEQYPNKPFELLKNIASELERGCYNLTVNICKENCIRNSWDQKQFVEIYSENCYRIMRELNMEINKYLLPALLQREVDPAKIMLLSDKELNPEGTKKEEDEINLRSQQRIEKRYSKTVSCGRCKGQHVEYREIQMRAADEPSTFKYNCADCQHTWSRTC